MPLVTLLVSNLCFARWYTSQNKDAWHDLKGGVFVIWCITYVISTAGLSATWLLYATSSMGNWASLPFVVGCVALAVYNIALKDSMITNEDNKNATNLIVGSLITVALCYVGIMLAVFFEFSALDCLRGATDKGNCAWTLFAFFGNCVAVVHGVAIDLGVWLPSFLDA